MDKEQWTKDNGRRKSQASLRRVIVKELQSVFVRAERAEFSTLSIVHLTLYFSLTSHFSSVNKKRCHPQWAAAFEIDSAVRQALLATTAGSQTGQSQQSDDCLFHFFRFSICLSFSGELPGDTQFYARRNAERPAPHSPQTSVSHFKCDDARLY